MTNSKNTKRALLISVLSMMLCVAMLIGSTFAWFTDSVTSGKNKIVAGNLDVELYHTNGKVTDEKVGETTNLFTDKEGNAVLWEPGVMVYENFTVKNVGSLALKYCLTVNAGNFNTVEGKSLKDVLKVAVLDDAFTGDRAAAQALTFDKTIADFEKTGNIAAGAADNTYAIVIYWEPTSADNDYNLNNGKVSSDGEPLFIDLGVNLVATQDTVEEDSFGKDYDENAGYLVTSVEEVKAAIKRGGNIVLADNVLFESTTDGDFVVDGKSTLDLNKKTLTGSNGNIATRIKAGEVTIQNGTIIADSGTYCTVSAFNGIANIENLILYNSTAYGMSLKAFESGTINIKNAQVNSVTGGGATAAGGVVNIFEGCSFTQTGKYDHNSTNVSASNGGTANVYGGTFSSDNFGLYVYNSGATINVYDGTFKAETVLKADKSTNEDTPSVINVYGGAFTGNIKIAVGASLNVEAGAFSETGLTLEQFSQYVSEGSTVSENNGTFVVERS